MSKTQYAQERLRQLNEYHWTIIPSRYSGVYSGAKVLAFNVKPSQIPPAATGDDGSCFTFWNREAEELDIAIGKGDGPAEALEDMLHNIESDGR